MLHCRAMRWPQLAVARCPVKRSRASWSNHPVYAIRYPVAQTLALSSTAGDVGAGAARGSSAAMRVAFLLIIFRSECSGLGIGPLSHLLQNCQGWLPDSAMGVRVHVSMIAGQEGFGKQDSRRGGIGPMLNGGLRRGIAAI